MPTHYKKICLLGDFAVGKTSLVRRYVDNQFSDEYLTTIGVKISRKLVELSSESGEHIAMQLIVWDLEGRSSFAEASNSYLQGASGAIIVGDVTRAETVTNIANHVQAFLAVGTRSQVVVALNKSDVLVENRIPPLQQFEKDKRFMGVQHTSAKNGTGVEDLFLSLAKNIIG
jgi:small GTP-binding protein